MGVKTLKVVLMEWILLYVWKATLNPEVLNVSTRFYRHHVLDFIDKILLFDIPSQMVRYSGDQIVNIKFLKT